MIHAQRAHAYQPAMPIQTETQLVEALRNQPRGFLTDIDGTLSAIAPTPDSARLYRGIRPLLRVCTARFDVTAAISGRPSLDARRLVGVPEMIYIGNHGMERLAPNRRIPVVAPEAEPFQRTIAEALADSRQLLRPYAKSLLFENKGSTASIHYRMAPDPEGARAAIRETLTPITQRLGLLMTEGKMVVEIRPPVKLDKGSSVRALVQTYSLRTALYLGDDNTDIDAFIALRDLRRAGTCQGFAVAVEHAEAPVALREHADVVLKSVAEVPRFIRWMLQCML